VPRTGVFRALRHRNYRLFFGGQTISLIGSWITRVATGWLVYRLTGSVLLPWLALSAVNTLALSVVQPLVMPASNVLLASRLFVVGVTTGGFNENHWNWSTYALMPELPVTYSCREAFLTNHQEIPSRYKPS